MPALSSIEPREGVTRLLALNGIHPEALADGAAGRLDMELTCLAQDARSAAQYIAESLVSGLAEFN